MMRLLAELRDDVRYAARTLRREPMLVLGVVLSVGLSIGANAAMVGLARRLLADAPPGVGDPSSVKRLALRFRTDDRQELELTTTSNPVAVAIGSLRAHFAHVAAVTRDTLVVGRGAELEEVSAVAASGDYFPALAARPLRGRFFDEEDARLPTGSNVVVLGHRFWQRRFGGDDAVLGRELLLDGQAFTVIGVAEPDFSGDEQGRVDVFVPLAAALRSRPGWWSDAHINLVSVIVRLRTGTPVVDAERAAAAEVRQALAGDPRVEELSAVSLRPLVRASDARESPQGKITVWLSAVSGVVVLLATANVATLLLLRAVRRRREIAVRLALGIGRPRLARQLLTEAVVLAGLGGAAGLAASTWFAELIRATLLPAFAGAERLVDGPLVGITVAMMLGVGVLAGVAPLSQLGGRDIISSLARGGTVTDAGRSTFPRLLVVLQVVLCTVLMAGAGLFLRSLDRVRTQDLGFSTADLLYVRLDPRVSMTGDERDRMHREAVARLTMLPGVRSATVADATPFGNFHVPPISVPGRAEPPNMGGQLPMMYGATPEYLRMMRVSLREGRLFDDRDGRTTPLVALVNESMARTVWPGERAVGQCIRVGFDPAQPPGPLAPSTLPCREVVGVVRDSRVRVLRATGNEARLLQYYVPFDQLPAYPQPDVPHVKAILVQTADDPAAMAGRVQRLIQSTAPVPVVARARPYQQLLEPQMRPWRQGATLFGALATLALGIAGVGAFAVVSYLVAQRQREIGVRLALGGTGPRIAREVVGRTLGTVGVGVAIGLMIAIAAGRIVAPLLFETSPRDAVVLVGTALSMLALAIIAAIGPASRAARTSPLVALRSGGDD